MPRKALGRGLSSLLREVETAATGLEQVSIGSIDPNPFQPRRNFPEESLQELSDSIRATGVVQPVLLRPSAAASGRFQLVAGERRWRAAKLAGLESLPALVRELSDRQTIELALTENLLREDLNPMDVARAYEALQRQFNLSHEEIADRLGVTRSVVTNTLRLLRLPEAVQEMVAAGQLSAGHARALASMRDPGAAQALAERILRKSVSVRQAEVWVMMGGEAPPQEEPKEEKPKMDPNVRAAVLELERTLGTRVRIVGTPERGRIEVQYFSAEDLNRLFDWIVRK
jgi:ParB family transcriptional regulator, chromosome partitioning protein